MKYTILIILVSLGFHGFLHRRSNHYLNVRSYKTNKERREKELVEFMHNNGLGA